MPWAFDPIRGGVKMWVFSQDTPASMWQINHQMGIEPIVEIQVPGPTGQLVKAYPVAIIQIDENNVEVQWSVPRTGKATLLAPN